MIYNQLQSITRSFTTIYNQLQSITSSVAVAVADVFSKNGHSIPNKFDKILKIFDRLDDVKS